MQYEVIHLETPEQHGMNTSCLICFRFKGETLRQLC